MSPFFLRRPAWAFTCLACALGHTLACAPAVDATSDTLGDVRNDAPEADAYAPDTTNDAPEPTDARESERRPDPDAHFVALDLPALRLHAPTRAPSTLANHLPALIEGAGAAFADVDGDGDLDVFLGAVDDVGLQSCVFENTSADGELRLERRATWCVDGPALAVAAPIDLDDDGRHELVAASPERAYLLRFDEGVTREALPAHAPGCVLGPLAVADLNHDGSTEIIAPCQLGASGDEADMVPRTVAWSLEGGSWEAAEASPSIAAMTLGVGHADVDGDGFLDLLSVTDTFALPDAYDPDSDPGGTYFGCADPPCAHVARWSDDRHAWGSYMGLASVRIGSAQHFVLTDIGAPHVARWSGTAWERVEPMPGDLFEPGDAPARVAWGVVADDLDDDGDEDLIFTFGVESLLLPSPRDAVANLALLQSESGTFAASERFTFPDPNDAIDPVWQLPRANRGATLVDLDLDGDAELFVLSVNGPPRVFEHRSRRERCTARVQPRYVDHGGAGYAWRGEDGNTWRLLEVGGETQLSAPAFVLLPAQRGTLRFPSGGQVSVDCGQAHDVTVAEPEWLKVSRAPGGVRVDVDADASDLAPASVRVRARDGDTVEAVPAAGEGFLASYEGPAPAEVMVSLAGQWVARWLPVADPP